MASLELSPNMQGLLEESVDKLAATVIIISDSNSEFIREILRVRGLEDRVDRVFTNPATWRQDGLLEIQPYHHQVYSINAKLRQPHELILLLNLILILILIANPSFHRIEEKKNMCRGEGD